MTAPNCPNCDELLVALDLLASGKMIYTCPRCKSNFDSSLKKLLVKGNKCIACEIGRLVELGADEMICDTCHARYNVREVIIDEPPSCPTCGAALVSVGLLASHIMVYNCPGCNAWFDSSLRAIGAPV